MTSTAAQNAKIADVFAVVRRAAEPLTIAQMRDALGWRHMPLFEVEQLVAKGALRRVANTPGVHCVDGRYEARPMKEWR